ncbi:putative DNA-binding transcriptional regulator YafY [Labedaea rhizosphaerae]|uniref:Putative DNA-binding transcriptional regulator YafY n=2 Tax=Labedaea rhizosphaerae TaxID=598644 RepID=A0A4V3CX56_LABRH|nr:putative DNA-binding transcriptional regulator YafY [Labedaea rhizosphaerae]
MLELLQRGGTRTVADLATRLDVDERTVRRYADHLRDLDIPVRSVRGRHGGYRLAPGYRMPPLMLTDEEALATLLGLVAGRVSAVSTLGAESAAAKIRRVLPESLGRKLDAVLDGAEFTAARRATPTVEAAVLLTLAEAARDRRPVEIAYTAGHGGAGRRVVHPYGVVAHAGRWYVTGADSASGEVRTFRGDRIAAADLREGTFEVPDGFDPVRRVVTGMADAPYRHEVSVRILASVEQVRTQLPPTVAVLSELDEGWQRAAIRAQNLDWLPPVLAALGRPFVVERPAELRVLVREFADRLRSYASAGAAG